MAQMGQYKYRGEPKNLKGARFHLKMRPLLFLQCLKMRVLMVSRSLIIIRLLLTQKYGNNGWGGYWGAAAPLLSPVVSPLASWLFTFNKN